MLDPILTTDGICYERESFEGWLIASQGKDPIKNNKNASNIIANTALKYAEAEWEALKADKLDEYYAQTLNTYLEKLKRNPPDFQPHLTQKEYWPLGLICPLTKKFFVDPVTTPYGDTYERAAIEQYISQYQRDPFSGHRLNKKDLIKNHSLRQVADVVRENYQLSKKTEQRLKALSKELQPISASLKAYKPSIYSSLTTHVGGQIQRTIQRERVKKTKWLKNFFLLITAMVAYAIYDRRAYFNQAFDNQVRWMTKPDDVIEAYAKCIPYTTTNFTECLPLASYGISHHKMLYELSGSLHEPVFVQLLTKLKPDSYDFDILIFKKTTYPYQKLHIIKNNEPLIFAAWIGDAIAIERLLTDKAVNIQSVNRYGISPILAVIFGKLLEAFHHGGYYIHDETFIDHAFDAQLLGYKVLYPFLDMKHYTYQEVFQYEDALKFLIAKGADLMATDKKGRTALEIIEEVKPYAPGVAPLAKPIQDALLNHASQIQKGAHSQRFFGNGLNSMAEKSVREELALEVLVEHGMR
jgi:hypothetical protein